LASKYGIAAFPTVLVVTPEGKIINRGGYIAGGAANYVKHLKSIIK